MRVEESIAIDRSPGEVFAFFDDRANDGRWMASVVESEWLDQAARTGVGRRGRMVMKLLGRREFLDQVVEYEPGTRVGSCRARWGPRTACIAEPAGDGCRATVLYEPERLPGGVLGTATAPLTAGFVRRSIRADLARLKDLLERRVAQ